MCTVTFDTDCSTKIDALTVEEGTIISKPEVELKKTGYNGYYALECAPMCRDQAKNFSKNIEFLSKYI